MEINHTTRPWSNRDLAEVSLATPKSLVELTEEELAEEFIAEVYKAHGVDIRETRQRVRYGKILINPTRGEVDPDRCHSHRVQPPWPPPKNGWSTPILMMARKGPPHFTDGQKEGAVDGVIAEGRRFNELRPLRPFPVEAFADPHWSLFMPRPMRLRAKPSRSAPRV